MTQQTAVRATDTATSEWADLDAAMARLRDALGMQEKVTRLTSSQVDLLFEVASGKTNAQIADDFHAREQTIKNRVTKLMRKLQVDNRVHLATLACLGYVPSETQLRARWTNRLHSRLDARRN